MSVRSLLSSTILLVVLCALTAGPAHARRRTAGAQTPAYAGPALAEILHEMQKPLPPLEDSDAPYLRELAQPPELGKHDASQWPNRFRGFFVYASLFVFGWCIATGRVTLPRGALARAGSWYEPPRRRPMRIASAASTLRRVLELPRGLTAVAPRPAVPSKPAAASKPSVGPAPAVAVAPAPAVTPTPTVPSKPAVASRHAVAPMPAVTPTPAAPSKPTVPPKPAVAPAVAAAPTPGAAQKPAVAPMPATAPPSAVGTLADQSNGRPVAQPTVTRSHTCVAAIPVAAPPVKRESTPPAPTRPAQVTALPLTPEPLSKSQIIHFKALTSFSSWRELLTAARAGNRVAREVLDSSPAHAAVNFELSAADFTRDFAWVRNIVLSRTWVDAILVLLRTTEQFDPDLTITTPFGARRTLPLSAPITALNSVLGYEELPTPIRRQLELRRWILWNTRTDGQEHPEVLLEFAADPVAQASAAGL